MGETWRFLKAEYRKMKGTYIPFIYVGVPILGCALFLLYYSFSAWNTESEIMAYAEAMGAALPLLISLLSAISVELEERNHFQTFLGQRKRRKAPSLENTLPFCFLPSFLFFLQWDFLELDLLLFLGKRE